LIVLALATTVVLTQQARHAGSSSHMQRMMGMMQRTADQKSGQDSSGSMMSDMRGMMDMMMKMMEQCSAMMQSASNDSADGKERESRK
jgi:hypothetical protein